MTHPGVKKTYDRMGKYAVSGKYDIDFSTLDKSKELIDEAKVRVTTFLAHISLLFLF